MEGRCISQNELAQRWQVSEATLERWRSQRKGLYPHGHFDPRLPAIE
jgi:DNA-binding transcriptional regulator YiaG